MIIKTYTIKLTKEKIAALQFCITSERTRLTDNISRLSRHEETDTYIKVIDEGNNRIKMYDNLFYKLCKAEFQ